MTEEEFHRLMAEAPQLDEFQKVLVKRSDVERWYGEPFWKDAIKGLFCRVIVGQDQKLAGPDKNVYRVAEIAGKCLFPSSTLYLSQSFCNRAPRDDAIV